MKVEVLKYPTEEDWYEAKRRCLVTMGKNPVNPPDTKWECKMLRCRHSPIRYLTFSFLITDIPRAEKPQGSPVNMIMDINADALITISTKRLCGCATEEMQRLMLTIREKVLETNPEFEGYLVPMCRHMNYGCIEFTSCDGKALYFHEVK